MLWGSLNKECSRLHLISVLGGYRNLYVCQGLAQGLGWPEIGPDIELGWDSANGFDIPLMYGSIMLLVCGVLMLGALAAGVDEFLIKCH